MRDSVVSDYPNLVAFAEEFSTVQADNVPILRVEARKVLSDMSWMGKASEPWMHVSRLLAVLLDSEVIPQPCLGLLACDFLERSLRCEQDAGGKVTPPRWSAIEVKRLYLRGEASDFDLETAWAIANGEAWAVAGCVLEPLEVHGSAWEWASFAANAEGRAKMFSQPYKPISDEFFPAWAAARKWQLSRTQKVIREAFSQVRQRGEKGEKADCDD